MPKERDFRQALVLAYEEEHQHVPGYAAYARAVDLLRTNDLAKAIRNLNSMLQFVPGAFVYHRSGWGVGEIKDVSHLEGMAIIDFEQKSGHRMKLEAIPQICALLGPEHFRVRAWRDREGLRRLADEDPVRIVKLVLAASEKPMTLKQLREALVGSILPSGDWSKWWGRVRTLLKKEPGIGMGGGRDATYFLQAAPKGVAEELGRRLQGLPLKERFGLLRETVGDIGPGEVEQLRPLLERLKRDLLRRDGDDALLLELLLFLRRHASALFPDLPGIEDYLERAEHPAVVINALPRLEDQVEVIEAVRSRCGASWPKTMVELILNCVDGPREHLVSRLVAEGRAGELDYWAKEVQRVPKKAPMYFLWLVRLAARGDLGHTPVLRGVPPHNLFGRAVSLLDDLSLRAEGSTSLLLEMQVRRYRSQLGSRPFTLLEQAIEDADLPSVLGLYHTIESSRGFSGTTRHRMLAVLLRKYPTLLAGMAKEVHVVDDNAIYSTDEGIRRLQVELDLIQNEKLPAVYRAIGDAAAMGDLSENYEFTSAVEERETLSRRALELKSQLERAVRIDLREVDTTRASIGSKVTLTNLASGHTEVYSILGPWDSHPTAGVVSYKAPLGRALLNRLPGEEFHVELPEGGLDYRLESVGPCR